MPPVNELPVKGSQFFARGPAALNRRQALNLLAAGIASGLAGCSKPAEEIIPYVKMPERVVPGEALKFATTLSLSGLRSRRHRHFDRWPPDQGRWQSAASRQPRSD